MSLQPPPAENIGDVFIDPITANRYEWDGSTWVNKGPNAEWPRWDNASVGKEPGVTWINQLRQLREQATDGPWKAEKREFGWWLSAEGDSALRPGDAPFADAEFIARAANLWPLLLDTIQAAEWITQGACTCDLESYDLGPEGQRRQFPDRGCPQHGELADALARLRAGAEQYRQ